MKSNVVYYILLLLDSENAVRIPGLGVLTRRIHSANILKEERKVKPPHSTVDFNVSDKEKGKLLARYISYKSGVDSKAASAHVSAFTNDLKSSLGKSGKISVDHLGVFQQEEDTIQFTPDLNTANASYFGLKTVQLPMALADLEIADDKSQAQAESVAGLSATTPGEAVPENVTIPLETIDNDSSEQLVEEVEAASESPPKSTPVRGATESSKRIRIPILLPVFLAIFLGVTALAIMQYNKRDAIYHPAATYNRSPGSDMPVFGSNEEPDLEDNSELDIAEELSDEDQTLPEVISENARELLGLIAQEDKSDVSDIAGNIETPETDEELQHDESTMEDGFLSEEYTSDDCFVIVGAFGVQSNVDRMMLRLTDMGYLPARMARRGLTQIGVPALCGSAEIQRVLEDLQLNVEAEAWIFKK